MLWLALGYITIDNLKVDVVGAQDTDRRPPVVEVIEDKDPSADVYTVAPKFGWTEEKQRLVDTYDPQKAKAKLQTLAQNWNRYLRRALNDEFVRSGYKEALCERYTALNKPCPKEHPLNEQMKELLSSYASNPDPWTYAEIVTTYEDMNRLVDAILKQNPPHKNLEEAKRNYHLAPVDAQIAKKPFSWEDGISLLDGNQWMSYGVAYTGSYEFNPRVVAVGGADTLVFAFNVNNCNSWCSGTTSNACVVVGHSYNRGLTMSLDFCIYNRSANFWEVAIGADPYRRTFTVAWTDDYYYPDIDIWAWTFYIRNPLSYNIGPNTVDFSGDRTITPYINSEFNWGRPGCMGRWFSSCSCSGTDNWIFVSFTKVGSSDGDGDGYADARGVKIARSTDCGDNYSIVYNGPSRNGSARDNNQIMLETTNDPRSGSVVCASYNGGDNTIQAVYDWKNPSTCSDPCTHNYITHLYTDDARGWGGSWVATDILSNYWKPINQPWLSVARTLNTSSMTHLVLFGSWWSSSDGDIRGIYGSGIPPSGWSSVFNVDFTTIDSRTPTVHTDARWQWCPGATTTTANYFHTAFYHKCPSSYDGRLCSASPSSYNNTFRVAVMRAPWSNPRSWGPEYCNRWGVYADTIAIPPPPSFSNGGLWQNWWQINGTTFRAHSTSGSSWWFGTFWVYKWSSSDYDIYWTLLRCAVGSGDDDLAAGEAKDTYEDVRVSVEGSRLVLSGYGKAQVFSSDGRLVAKTEVKGKGSLSLRPGAYFVRTGNGVRKVVVR